MEILFTHLLCLGAGNLYQHLFWEIPVCQTCSSTRKKTFIYNSVKNGTKPKVINCLLTSLCSQNQTTFPSENLQIHRD